MASGNPETDETSFKSTSNSILEELSEQLGAARIFRDGDKQGLVIPLDGLQGGSNLYTTETYDPVNCSVCEDLAIGRPNKAIWRQRSISELHAGAEEGCKYCMLLCKGIRACVPQIELTDDNALHARLAKVFPQVLGEGRSPNKYGISVFRGEDDEHWINKVIGAGSTPSGDTSSPAALNKAKGWLQQCLDQHDRCGKGGTRQAPTRLIDTELDQSQDVKLVELNGAECQYVCLSHCWGKTDSIKLTKETLQLRKDRINWASLCPTFQDAVNIVRQLGLRFLWIDSLCIIQDDPEDWDRESSQMATVYSSAHLTIAATRSPNHDGGCFSETKAQFKTHEVSVTTPNLTLFFRQTLPHTRRMILSPEQAEEFPLLDRSWVYQERLLSPRVLHFQNNELAWECSQCSECECDDRVDPSVFMGSEYPKLDHANALDKPSFGVIVNRWHQLVQEFSRLKMSFQKDALPALSGLASQMSHYRENHQYVVGMWDYTIFIDMLWIAEDDRARRPQEWRGPSWSWVSTTSPVRYVSGLVYAMIETYPSVLDSNVRLSSSDNRFGPVTHPTWFKIRGTVFKSGTLRFIDQSVSEEHASGVENYDITIRGSPVGVFHADYDLTASSGRFRGPLSDGSSIELLLMAKTDNWNLYLVLITHISAPEYLITHNFEDDNVIDIRGRIGLLQVQHHFNTVDPVRRDLEESEEEILLI